MKQKVQGILFVILFFWCGQVISRHILEQKMDIYVYSQDPDSSFSVENLFRKWGIKYTIAHSLNKEKNSLYVIVGEAKDADFPEFLLHTNQKIYQKKD